MKHWSKLVMWFAWALLVGSALVSCNKKSTPAPAMEKAEDEMIPAPTISSPQVSLDTIPFKPLRNTGLFRDLSQPDDSVIAAEAEKSVVANAVDSFIVRIPADTQKIIQMSGLPRRVDSLTSERNIATSKASLYSDSLTRTIQELGALRNSISQRRASEDSATEKRVAQLSKVVETMKPAAAATMLDKLPPKLAAQVIAKLKERQAGKVLAALPPVKSSQLALMIKNGDHLKKDNEPDATAPKKSKPKLSTTKTGSGSQ